MIARWEEDGRSATGVDRKGLKNISQDYAEYQRYQNTAFSLKVLSVSCFLKTKLYLNTSDSNI